MTDREFLLQLSPQLASLAMTAMAINNAVNQHLAHSVDPGPDPGPDPGTPSTPVAGAGQQLGWTEGQPLFARDSIQTFGVTPSADWLALAASNAAYLAAYIAEHGSAQGAFPARGGPQVATLTLSGGYNPAAGPTPPFVLYSIGGATMRFNGSNQDWTFDPRFPNGFPLPTGPFVLTVQNLDAFGNPASGYGVAVQLNHSP